MQANIFDIQKSRFQDGPGLRTVVFFRGCPLRCPWCPNPRSQHRPTQILWDSKKCLFCHLCQNNCPTGSLAFKDNQLKFNYKTCLWCRSCVIECPAKSLHFVGKMMELDEVMDEILDDASSYEQSGGGVTLSGGEALMQPAFAAALLKRCKEHSIHTALETSGHATPLVFSKVIAHTDLLLLDIKHYCDKAHIKYTGVSNQSILENLDFAIAMNVAVTARIPIIAGVNDSLADAAEFIRLLTEHHVKSVCLMPFKYSCIKKYESLYAPDPYENTRAARREDLAGYFKVFYDSGLQVTIEEG